MAGAQIEQFQFGESTLTAFITVFNAALLGHLQTRIELVYSANCYILPGSVIECNGNIYEFSEKVLITAYWGGGIVAGTNYIGVVEVSGALIPFYDNTAPTWDNGKRGYYRTISGNVCRYISIYYNTGSKLVNKYYLTRDDYYDI